MLRLNKSKPIYVISDIHGGLELIQELLEQVEEDAYLFLLGDYFEKGKSSLKTLNFIMDLSRRANTYMLLGNNDDALLSALEEKNIKQFKNRLDNPTSIIYDMKNAGRLKGGAIEIQKQMKEKFPKEITFIKKLPLYYETDDFVFVHAGIDGEDFTNREALLKFNDFYNHGHSLEKIVICGHYPTATYHLDRFDNSIIIDLEKRIISIDGGYGATNFGQLNVLKITHDGEYKYESFHSDYFPKAKVVKPQKAMGNKRGLCYPNYEIKLIRKGKYFSEAIDLFNGEVVNVKNEFIITKNNKYYTIDDTPNNLLEVNIGDVVGVLNRNTAGYALVKKEGIFGWVAHKCIEEEQ